MVLAEVIALCDLNSGSVKYTLLGQEAEFDSLAANKATRKPFLDNHSFAYQVQLQIDITRGSNANTTPNAVPVAFRTYHFVGVPPKPPGFIDDQAQGVDPVLAL